MFFLEKSTMIHLPIFLFIYKISKDFNVGILRGFSLLQMDLLPK